MKEKTRSFYAMKNVFMGYACTFFMDLIAFTNRTVLVWVLGKNYVGINGLFTDILGVLSFAELGIGTALNFSLYKPIAENDKEKVKSLMQLYKTAYRIIACVIALVGICLLPFLQYIVKDPGNVGNIRIYYCVFLFNTVTSYFVSYKYSLVNARQENYLFSILNMVTRSTVLLVQIGALYASKNYLIYLMAGVVIDLMQKVWVSHYLNRRYPILNEKNISPLESAEKVSIWKNVRALIWHKVGEVSVHQTDNIIVSAFIDIATVGKVTYHNSFIQAANQLLSVAMNAVVGGLGNAISREDTEKKYALFKAYRFVAFWLYGYAAIGLYIMLPKLVKLLVGEDMLLPDIVLFLVLLNFYLMGKRIALNNMKIAGGIFQEDKFVALLQAGVNIVTSIFLVKQIGLPGVYVGTVLQGLLATIIKPIIIYKNMFHQKAIEYFISGGKYLASVFFAGSLCVWGSRLWFQDITLFHFVLEIIFVSLIVNSIFLLFFKNTKEFHYIWTLLRKHKG